MAELVTQIRQTLQEVSQENKAAISEIQKVAESTRQLENKLSEALARSGRDAEDRIAVIQKDLGVMSGEVNKKIDDMLEKQDHNRKLIEHSKTLVENLEG